MSFLPSTYTVCTYICFLQHPYEDPEGRIDLPSSIKCHVDHWKRPIEFILEKVQYIAHTGYSCSFNYFCCYWMVQLINQLRSVYRNKIIIIH